MQKVWQVEHVDSGERTSGEASTRTGPLVVLSPTLGTVGRASSYVEVPFYEGKAVMVGALHIEQAPAIFLVSGSTFMQLFMNCEIVVPDWTARGTYIMGDWVFWKTSRPDIVNAGFVVGVGNYSLDSAIKKLKEMTIPHERHVRCSGDE